MTKYSVFNYVLPTENKRLIKFQKDGCFINAESAYASAGINLIDITLEELNRLRKNLKSVN